MMPDFAEMLRGLTDAQKRAIYPGPGNEDRGSGPLSTMKALERLGVVTQISQWPSSGGRGALLTPAGAVLRRILAAQHLNETWSNFRRAIENKPGVPERVAVKDIEQAAYRLGFRLDG